MDYCSSCRRHLNGALVCPGCGAYAPDIAPPTADGRSGSAPATTSAGPATTAHRDPTASGTWHDSLLDGEAESSTAMGVAPYIAADVEDLPPVRQGRAARRRRLARWKKNKRRAAVASAVAFVGGGLSIAMMDRHSTDRAQAAVALDDRKTGAVQEQTPEQKPPTTAPATAPHTRRPSHAPSQPPTTTDAPRQQSLAAPSRTTPSITRPDTAAPAHPAATPPPQPQSTAPAADDTAPDDTAPDRSGTTAEQQSAPATGDVTKPGTPRTSPSRVSTSPTEVCLLGLCLG
ncbi:hypothetical protein OH809_19200 [Streptomyces sp. NBC_00873]|uniref:SCO2400 family protein n=1 Tax=unclassified Streptomyces TaxID=2593676 RepID=UPI00387043EC|nr:hypothetical protein OH809_19200 [Streptomyces sp. NBC_00873]WTA45377.1 hypothetical protein OH821_24495 [Streptomyces sp. NBC_00842]